MKKEETVESGSMDIVHYQGECPECKHFIGLTQTPEEEAREFIERTISSAKQEEVQRIIELAEKMKSKDYYSPNFLTRITQGEMEDHLLINDLITTLKGE